LVRQQGNKATHQPLEPHLARLVILPHQKITKYVRE
jgi:hypothetical protein